MSGFRPVDPKQSFPELERAGAGALARTGRFERQLAQRRDAGAPVWSFYDGPADRERQAAAPTTSSRATFKDVYPRYRAMRGNYVPRKAGWDCHGLPVELEIEKELGISVEGRDRGLRDRASSTSAAASPCSATSRTGTG